MAFNNFTPIIWDAQLLVTLDKSLVYAGAPCSNRDYEGDITAYGSSVKITSIQDPTISTYVKGVDLAGAEDITDSSQTLTIDQANSFNFGIDDIDKAQVRNAGGAMDEATRRAAFGLRDKADQFAAAKMAAAAGVSLGAVDASTTASNVYDQVLVPASVALDQANIPEELRWIVLPPAVYGKLQLDSRFIRQNESGTAALHNGQVGDAAGFTVITDAVGTSGAFTITSALGQWRQSDVGSAISGTGVGASSKVVSVTPNGVTATVSVANSAAVNTAVTVAVGTSQLVIAGTSLAHSFAQQILETKAYSPEKRFGDALKGLHVFGSKVIRPAALVVAPVKTS
jgi:hypothetical protein